MFATGVVDRIGDLVYGLGEVFGVVALCGRIRVGLLVLHTTHQWRDTAGGLWRRGSRGEGEVASW